MMWRMFRNMATSVLREIEPAAVAQLSGDPDWGAGVTLAQADIAYRHRNYDAARTNLQTVTPVFTKKNADPYLERSFETLKASLDG